jgi:hypothetical protein
MNKWMNGEWIATKTSGGGKKECIKRVQQRYHY